MIKVLQKGLYLQWEGPAPNKLLVQYGGNLVDNPGIFNKLTLAMAGMGAGLYAFRISGWLIVKATWYQ
jgi:hypothetical protein